MKNGPQLMVSPLQADAPEPLWVQAAAAITREIAAKAISPGGRLPPERDLLGKLAISRVTLRRALQSLVESGVLVSSHGRGWFVATETQREFPPTLESFSETAARLGLTASSDVLRAEPGSATLDDAEALRVAPGSAVFRLRRIRRLDGVPVADDNSVMPWMAGLNLETVDFRSASIFKVMLAIGVDLAQAEASIEAQAADAELAQHLGIEPGRPVLAMKQRLEDSAGRTCLCSDIRYAGDRYRLRTSFSRPPAGRS